MKKLLNPFFEENYDGFGAGIMEPIINMYPNEWILKRIQHNAKVQKLHIDLNKVVRHIDERPSYQKQSELFKISEQVYYGELREIFNLDTINPKKEYTKKEIALAIHRGTETVQKHIKELQPAYDIVNGKRVQKKRGSEYLYTGNSVIALDKKINK